MDHQEVVSSLGGVSLSQQHKNAAAVEKYGSNVLKLYLPGEYLGENVIGDFEKQFGVRVIVENFDSNEMMYTKLMAGDKYEIGTETFSKGEGKDKVDYVMVVVTCKAVASTEEA